MSNKVRFVVVGCGHIGKRHAQMIQENPEAELVALVDIREKAVLGLEAFAIPFFNRIEDLAQAGLDYDVVNIAVPNGLHATIASFFIGLGKDVVIEKPMALKAADAESLLAQSKAMNTRIFVVMQNRYSPPSAWLKEIISNKVLGDIYLVELSCYWNRDARYYTTGNWHGTKDLDGGTLFTQFSHFIDILYWLFGNIRNVNSRFYDFNHQQLTDFEDSGMVHFEFEQGGVGSFCFSTAVWNKNLESSLTIIGSKGSVKVGGQYMDKVEYCEIKDYTMPALSATNPGNDYGIYKGSAANHHFVIKNVIDVIKRGAEMTTTAEDGIAVVQMIEAMYGGKKKAL